MKPLRVCGYEVVTASDGLEGINTFHAHHIDLILLDIMLPKINGYAVCEMIRQEARTPIILLTALDTEADQIKGFDLLADDYITKPFSIKLVLKRVEALFRRIETMDMDTDTLRYKEVQISAKQRQVLVSGAEVILTQSEFDILLLFLKNQGRVFTRDELLNLVWGYEFIGEEKSVNFHIMNLRKKLGVDFIDTVRGVGYKIAKENQ
jgi:two-component system response regulator VanR